LPEKRRENKLNESSSSKKIKEGSREATFRKESHANYASFLDASRIHQQSEKLTRCEKGKELSENLTRIKIVNKKNPLFNVSDWAFLREDPHSWVSAEKQK
jgi:hypothetical protein